MTGHHDFLAAQHRRSRLARSAIAGTVLLSGLVAIETVAPAPAHAVLTQAARSVLLSEDFETTALGAIPTGWTQGVNNAIGLDWQTVATTPGTVPQGIPGDHTPTGPGQFLGHDDFAGIDQQQVFSPPIALPVGAEAYADFWLHSYIFGGNHGNVGQPLATNTFRVYVTDAAAGTVLNGGLPLFEVGDTDVSGVNGWQLYSTRLAPYAGQTIKLRIDFDGSANIAAHDFGLDDMSVYTVTSPTPQPLARRTSLTFFSTVPEDHVQAFHKAITPVKTAGCTATVPLDPVTSITSITAASDNTIILYDHWEDGFGPADIRTQWTTEIWGDGNPANGFPQGIPSDVVNAGTVVTLQSRVDPQTRRTVIDYDGGDRITSPDPLVISRLAYSDSSSTLMAGATEVYDLSYWGNRFVIPAGTNSPIAGSLFEYSAASISAERNNTRVFKNGALVATLQMGEAYLTPGNLVDGDFYTSTGGNITMTLLAGDVCANYETDWFTLMPTRLWDNEYYSPVSGGPSDTGASIVPSEVHLYNPLTVPLTINYTFGNGTSGTVSVSQQGTSSVPIPAGFGSYFYTGTPGQNNGSSFYAIQSFDTGNSARDWGYGLLPADQLSPVLQAGYAPGADPTVLTTQNVSPIWVTAVYRGVVVPAPTAVTVCIDYNGDQEPVQAGGLTYDATLSVGVLSSTKIKDPDGDNTAMRVFVCNPTDPNDPTVDDWGLAGAWGQESQAPGGSPAIDVGTGMLNLPTFDMDKSISQQIDDNNNGVIDVGDTVEYSLLAINTSGIFMRTNRLQVLDGMPTELGYVPGSTQYAPASMTGTPTGAFGPVGDDVVGAASATVFPLDDPDAVGDDGVDDGFLIPRTTPGRTGWLFKFRAKILRAPANNVIVNQACVTDQRFTECDSVSIVIPEFGSIGDRVWLDENGDGGQNAGEDGVTGVVVELRDGAGTLIATTVTDANGGYLFRDLPVGTYTVSIMPPTGMAHTYDRDGGTATPNASSTVTLGPPTGPGTVVEITDVDFGLNWGPPVDTGNGAIGDRVWADADGDGRQDPGEVGLEGVTVTLYGDPDGDGVYDTVVATTTTNSSGNYIFDDLPPAGYVVAVTPPAGAVQTGDPDSTLDHRSSPILLSPGDIYLNADFGYRPAASNTIGDTVWLDGNGNGTVDPNEPGFAGVSVVLLDAAGNIVATTVTDAAGRYSFTGVPDGTFTVWVNDSGNVLREYSPISNPTGDTTLDNRTPVSVAGGQTVNTADFGYASPNQDPAEGMIGDTIWLDRNGDGVFTVGEGIEGVRVDLFDRNGQLVGVSYTNEQGIYSFGDLSDGVYRVDVVESTLPPGVALFVDPDNAEAGASIVTLGAGEQNYAQDFGYRGTQPPASLGGTIWNDIDANGVLFADEVVRSEGVTVVLRDVNGNVIAETTTDAAGNYVFVGLPAGTYTVDVTDDRNVLGGYWHSLGPDPTANYNSHRDPTTVTVGAGESNNTIDFGYYNNPSSVGDFIWEDADGSGTFDIGELPIEGVKVALTITYPDGTIVTLVTTTDATGQYRFDNLLLDEDFDGVGADEPTFSIVVTAPADMIPTNDTTPDPSGVGGGIDGNADNPAGEPAFPAEGRPDFTNDFGFRPRPAIQIVKSTNNVDANAPTGPFVVVGNPVTWTYVVTNTGAAVLHDVVVNDDNGTPADPADDPTVAYVSGDTGADGRFGPGEEWIYEAAGVATAGQYGNIGTATATDPANKPITDTDPSHYFGVDTKIAVAKTPETQTVAYRATADFTITVTNPGNVGLATVVVTDGRCTTPLAGPQPGEDTAPLGILNAAAGETWTFTCSTANVTADFTNTASVTGTPVDDGGTTIPGITPPTASDTATVDVTPSVSVVKDVVSSTHLGGGAYRTTYNVTVTNLGPATVYGVTDALQLGAGVTATTVTASALSGGGTVAAGFDGQATTTLATGIALAEAPAADVYRVVVDSQVDAAVVSSTSGDCVADAGETSTGISNSATVTYETLTAADDACAPVPPADLSITKALVSGPTLDPATGQYALVYGLTVVNAGDGPGRYDLADTLTFGAGVTVIGMPTATNTTPGTITTNAAWTGRGATTAIVTGQGINGGATHRYEVRVTADATAVADAAAADCDPATDGPGTGFLNAATLNDGTVSTDAAACTPVPRPSISLSKTVVAPAPVRNADGTYTVTYQLDVANAGPGAGRYDLTDTTLFGADVTLVGTPTATESGTAVGFPQLATGRLLLAGEDDRYTVAAIVTVAPAITPAARDCDPATAGPTTGLLNSATLTVTGVPVDSDACVPVPAPNVTVTKSPVSQVTNADGTYQVVYSIVVTNSGEGPGSYDLVDTPTFGAGVTLSSASVTGVSTNPAGAIATNAAWDGVAESSVVAAQAILPGTTDTYTVTIAGSIAGVTSPAAGDCTMDAGETGTGFRNVVTLTVDGTDDTDDACDPNPPPAVALTKAVPSGPTLRADGNYDISYLLTAVNTGGLGRYDLTDTFQFGPGITVVGMPVVTNTAPGALVVNPAFNGTTDQAIIAAAAINAGATHTYRVDAVVDARGMTVPADGICVAAPGGPGSGMFNTATLVVDGVNADATACEPVPRPDVSMHKDLVSGPTLDAATGQYLVTYTVTVANAGDGPGRYDLADRPSFGDGVTIASATMTNDAGGDTSGWNGSTVTTAATSAVIAGQATHTYTVAMAVDALGLTGPGEATCDAAIGGPTRGLLNTATLTIDGAPTTDDACGDIPPAQLTLSKQLDPAAPITEVSPGVLRVTYLLTMTNSGDGPGRYDLVDDIRYGIGITPAIVSVTAIPATLAPNPAWAGTGALLTGQAIAAHTTHTVQVTVDATVDAGTPLPARDCDSTNDPTVNTGFLNAASMTAAGGTAVADDACAPAPSPILTIAKAIVGTAAQNADGSYTVVYDLTITNTGDGPGLYSLADDLGYPTGVAVGLASAVAQTAATPAPLASWNGATSPAVVTDQAIPAGATHVYRITTTATVTPGLPATDRTCASAINGPDQGFLNHATLTTSGVDTTVEACEPIPAPQISMVKTLDAGSPTLLANGNYAAAYTIVVTNAAAAGPGAYDLVDDLAFGAGVTVVSASMTTDVVGVDTSMWSGSGAAASAVGIVAGATHTYSVHIEATVAPTIAADQRDCLVNTPGEGSGLLNTASISVDGASTGSAACGEVPAPDLRVTKTVAPAPTLVTPGVYSVVYEVVVENVGDGPGVYDLDDRFAFAPGVAPVDGTAAVTTTATGVTPSVTFNGLADPRIVTGQPIVGLATHRYRVTVQIDTRGLVPTLGSNDCALDTGELGTGMRNSAALTIAGQTTDADACAPIPLADVSLVKTVVDANGGPLTIGDIVDYTIVVANAGPDAATNVVVVDNLPAGLVYGSATITGGDIANDFGAPTLTWDIRLLTPNTTVTLTYSARLVPTADIGGYLNAAEVTSSDQVDPDSNPDAPSGGGGFETDDKGDGVADDDESQVALDPQIADLSIVKSVSDMAPSLGATLTYTLVVTNGGPHPATNVAVTDVLPVGLQYVAGTAAGGTSVVESAAPTLTWSIAQLDPSTSATLTYNATVLGARLTDGKLDPAAYINIAEITRSDQYDPDSDPSSGSGADDRSDGTSDDDESAAAVLPASIGLAKAVQSVVNNGDGAYTVAYRLVVRNLGLVEITDLVINDDVATQLAAASPTAISAIDGSLVADAGWTGGAGNLLAAGQSLPVGGSGDLMITATLRPGGNLGPHVNQATVSGGSPSGTPVGDTSTDGADPDPDGDGNPEESDPTPVTFTEHPVIGLAKRVSAGPVEQSRGVVALTYELIVSNMGDVPLSGVQVVDDLSLTFPGLPVTVVSLTAAGAAANLLYDGRTDTNLLSGGDTLAPGASATITLAVVITAGDKTGPFDNSAVARGTSPSGQSVTDRSQDGIEADPNGNGDPGDDNGPTPVRFASPTPTDLRLRKTVERATALIGENTSWTITVTNAGTATAEDVVVTDTLPVGLTFVAAGSSPLCTPSAGLIVRCAVGTVAPGASVSLTIVTTTSVAGTYRNLAVVSAWTPDPNPGDNEGTATVVIDVPKGPGSNPGTIPATGSNVVGPLGVGGMLVGLGLSLLALTRRRRQVAAALLTGSARR